MKYVILLCLLVSTAYAGKERGGGSLARLLNNAGITIVGQPKVLVKHDIQESFFDLAFKFMTDLNSRYGKGQAVFQNAAGQRVELTQESYEKILESYYNLRINGFSVRKRITSSRGDSISFVNNPALGSIIVNSEAFEKILNIANPYWAEGLGMALVGHEILSLAGVESSDQFAVSATIAADVLLKDMLLQCGAPAVPNLNVIITVDKTSRQIGHPKYEQKFSITRIEVDLSEVPGRLEFFAQTGMANFRLSQFGRSFDVEFAESQKLSGATESFYVFDTNVMPCTLLSYIQKMPITN